MESTYEMYPPAAAADRPERRRGRLKTALGGLLLAALVATGAASAFAASPEPSPGSTSGAGTPATTDDAGASSSETTDRADCPYDAAAEEDSG
jgi:hypothetical protein